MNIKGRERLKFILLIVGLLIVNFLWILIIMSIILIFFYKRTYNYNSLSFGMIVIVTILATYTGYSVLIDEMKRFREKQNAANFEKKGAS